jgi:hypothetical protein
MLNLAAAIRIYSFQVRLIFYTPRGLDMEVLVGGENTSEHMQGSKEGASSILDSSYLSPTDVHAEEAG